MFTVWHEFVFARQLINTFESSRFDFLRAMGIRLRDLSLCEQFTKAFARSVRRTKMMYYIDRFACSPMGQTAHYSFDEL